MVRKGSSVRVRQRALMKSLLLQGFRRSRSVVARRCWVRAGSEVRTHQVQTCQLRCVWDRSARGRCGRRAREKVMDQLELPLANEPSSEYLTIAEASRRVRCCERTIRRAIESGALRAGRIRGERGSRGGF